MFIEALFDHIFALVTYDVSPELSKFDFFLKVIISIVYFTLKAFKLQKCIC